MILRGLLILVLCAPGWIHAGLVEDWNKAFEQAVQVETTPPALAARNLALLHISMHDAYMAAAGTQRLLLANAASLPDARQADPTLAAAAAAHRICTVLFPSRAPVFSQLYTRQLRVTTETTLKTYSVRLGQAIASQILHSRSNDGSATTVHYVPKTGEGQWRRTTRNRPPELPHWPLVRTFCLESANQFRPPPPPLFKSKAFQKNLGEVEQLGGKHSTTRSSEQTEIARFWSDFNYTSTPPGHWNQITRALTASSGITTEGSIRLFAVLNIGLADAGLAAFDCKYHYNFWRPVTALHKRGKTDWDSLLSSPSHPEYVSAHSTFSAAAARILEEAFPTLSTPIEVQSDTLPGVTRTFTRFLDCETEVGISRIYGGIHYTVSNLEGRKLGRKVGDWVLTHYPLHPPAGAAK